MYLPHWKGCPGGGASSVVGQSSWKTPQKRGVYACRRSWNLSLCSCIFSGKQVSEDAAEESKFTRQRGMKLPENLIFKMYVWLPCRNETSRSGNRCGRSP